MREPRFLTVDEVLAIHLDQVELYGGESGVRDLGLLQSAVAMPQSGFGGVRLHKDLFEMAAAYLFHIVQNHPFLDGNKRTGTAAALVFLELNRFDFTASEDDLYAIVIAIAENRAEKADMADFFRKHCREYPKGTAK